MTNAVGEQASLLPRLLPDAEADPASDQHMAGIAAWLTKNYLPTYLRDRGYYIHWAPKPKEPKEIK